jgi:hypothetical protein
MGLFAMKKFSMFTYCFNVAKSCISNFKHSLFFYFSKDNQSSQTLIANCSSKSEKEAKLNRIEFADFGFESCITEAIALGENTAFYKCSDYIRISPWKEDYLYENRPDNVYSENIADIDTIFFCDFSEPVVPPDLTEENAVLADLRKLSNIKRLLFFHSDPSFKFRIKLFLAMPKVRCAYRSCYDDDDISILEHIKFIIDYNCIVNTCRHKLYWSWPIRRFHKKGNSFDYRELNEDELSNYFGN